MSGPVAPCSPAARAGRLAAASRRRCGQPRFNGFADVKHRQGPRRQIRCATSLPRAHERHRGGGFGEQLHDRLAAAHAVRSASVTWVGINRFRLFIIAANAARSRSRASTIAQSVLPATTARGSRHAQAASAQALETCAPADGRRSARPSLPDRPRRPAPVPVNDEDLATDGNQSEAVVRCSKVNFRFWPRADLKSTTRFRVVDCDAPRHSRPLIRHTIGTDPAPSRGLAHSSTRPQWSVAALLGSFRSIAVLPCGRRPVP